MAPLGSKMALFEYACPLTQKGLLMADDSLNTYKFEISLLWFFKVFIKKIIHTNSIINKKIVKVYLIY